MSLKSVIPNWRNSSNAKPRVNPFLHLDQFDTIVLVDDSGSMLTDLRWGQAHYALYRLVSIASKYVKEGVMAHFLGHYGDRRPPSRLKSPRDVDQLLRGVRPKGYTRIGKRLEEILNGFIARVEKTEDNIKPVNILVLTDGELGECSDSVIFWPEYVIARAATILKDKCCKVGIQFVQIGNKVDAGEFMQSMQSKLEEYKIRGMVGITLWNPEEDIVDICRALAAVIKRQVVFNNLEPREIKSEEPQPEPETLKRSWSSSIFSRRRPSFDSPSLHS